MKIKSTTNKGFSLVEMGIALLIIAALILSITGGVVVREKLQLKRIIDGFNEIASGVTLFQNENTNALPGDLWNATRTLGSTATNGNGNKTIDGIEYLLFWQHLSLAGMVNEGYDGITNQPGIGVMKGILDNSGYYVYSDTTTNRLTVGFALYNDTDGSGTIERNDTEDRIAALEPEDAWHLDDSYDDGRPGTGFIRGLLGSNNTGTCTIDSNATPTPSDPTDDVYNRTNSDVACIIEIIIDEQIQ